MLKKLLVLFKEVILSSKIYENQSIIVNSQVIVTFLHKVLKTTLFDPISANRNIVELYISIFFKIFSFVWNHIPDFPTSWHLLKYLLPRKIQRNVFEPAYEELMADYFISYDEYHSFSARIWLRFCFSIRTLLMLLDCYRAMGIDKIFSLLPARIRHWWLG